MYHPAIFIEKIKVVFILSVIFKHIYASEVLRPRGVSLSKASLYDPQKNFVCFDGSISIPFSLVNDDYCDCPDGSDEPGTPACPNGTFHCTNSGHRPLNIPSSRVNDGICDCCDGSDEYAKKALCVNNCSELGRAARIAAQKFAELRKSGNEMRIQLSKKGKQLKQEKQEKLQQVEKDMQIAQQQKEYREAIKKEKESLESEALEKYKKEENEAKETQAEVDKKVNEEEAFEYFHKIDSNQDGRLEKVELQSVEAFDHNKDGVVTDEEIHFFTGLKDDITWEEFLSLAWMRVKPMLMVQQGLFTPPSTESPEQRGDTEHEEDVEEKYEEDGDDIQEEEDEDEEGTLDDEEEEGEDVPSNTEEEEKKPEDSSPTYDDETQALIDEANAARSEYDKAEREWRDLQREVDQLRRTLEMDYGDDEEFAPLDGECFEFTDAQYTYKFCPFDEVTQRSKSGGSDTRLGTWNGWVGEEKYRAMLYDKGQSCWNGPQRSTYVKLLCGLENALTAVNEPNRCEYVMEFVTPTACRVTDGEEHSTHDEL